MPPLLLIFTECPVASTEDEGQLQYVHFTMDADATTRDGADTLLGQPSAH